MPSIETSIWLALKARVEALVLTPALPIAWPNLSFDMGLAQYLRVTHIPNFNRRRLIGSADAHQRRGLLQIDHFAKLNQNVAISDEVAGQIAAWFPVDKELSYGAAAVRIYEAPQVVQGMKNDAGTHWMTPVTIPYETWA